MISKILPRWKYTGNTQRTTLKELLGGLQSTAELLIRPPCRVYYPIYMEQLYSVILSGARSWSPGSIFYFPTVWGASPVIPLQCSAVKMLALLLPPLISQFIFSQLRFEYEERTKQKVSSRRGEMRPRDRDRHISDLTRARLLLKLFELETHRIKHGFFRTQFLSVSAQHL